MWRYQNSQIAVSSRAFVELQENGSSLGGIALLAHLVMWRPKYFWRQKSFGTRKFYYYYMYICCNT